MSPNHGSIPRSVLDHYNSSYNNQTYRIFRDKLRGLIGMDDERLGAVMNLLIDASFERGGANCYAGAEASLMVEITPLGQRIIDLALAHLMHFGPKPQRPQETLQTTAHEQLRMAQTLTEQVASTASDLRSWRGRVAFAWTSAATYLLHAASAVLLDSHYDSYPAEKLDRALEQVYIGVLEAKAHGFMLPPAFVLGIKSITRARD